MAFVNRIGNVLKKTVSRHMNLELSAPNSSYYQAIRSMSSSKLFVGGLSYGMDDMSLRDAFSQHGEVIEARIIMDRDTGRSRGFGFVTYTSSEQASSAIQALDGKDLHGRLLKVNYATEKARGSGFRGGYGGGDGGYGGPGGYGSGSYGGAGYGGDARGGYGSGNYGSGGGSNYSGSSSRADGFGGSYYGGGGGTYPRENNSSDSNYNGGGNVGGYGAASAGGGGDYFNSGSTNQGGFATSEYDGNASASFGKAQENLSANQVEPDAVHEDFGQDSIADGNCKDDDDDDEPNNYGNTRA